MSTIAWNNFCDRIDDALRPLNKLLKVSGFATCIFFIAFIAVPLLVIIPASTNMDSSPNVLAFMIGPLVAMAGLISTQCVVVAQMKKTMEELKIVCNEVSKQQPRLSFHVRFERHYYGSRNDRSSHSTNYIEVIIAGASISVPMATAIEPAVTYATAPVMEYPFTGGSTTGKSPAERLANLEEMKLHISVAEYNAKRDDIINSV